jgi:hypothetical protein
VKEKSGRTALLISGLIFVLVVAVMLMLPGLRKRGRGHYVSYLPAPPAAEAAEVSSWTQAVRKVKEDRGEPAGKQAKVETPAQLRHYSDTRRFLAVQYAEWREHHFETPKDFADLAAMLERGEMVELRPVTRDYILFGVGGSADKEPFTRYADRKRITLYGEAELAAEYARVAESRSHLENEIAGLRRELGSLEKSERARRVRLQSQVAEKEKALKAEAERKEFLDRYYGDADARRRLFSAYSHLDTLAKSLPGRDYDINDGRARQELKVRMLSSLRPEALKVMEEVASAYREKFDRPLPLSSLVRPDEYQHALSKVNPNATRMETPPHSTGLAFDVYNRFMTAEEQSFVMAYLARLKDEGRIEVLRENRDHYHVFAFIDGARPNEELISASLGKTKAPKAAKETDKETDQAD